MAGFQIGFVEDARKDLTWLTAYERKMIIDEIKRQLSDQPTVETRNRKMLRDNPLARWELRVGKYRVFYEVAEGVSTVLVGAIGVKEHDRLYIRGQEVRL
jgi:mRNA-degrading endonuclease RelE of RelBE toxin-antitoxin system